MANHKKMNYLPDNTTNEMHPWIMTVSQSKNDVLFYDQVMKANDADSLREEMGKDIKSFKDKETSKITPTRKKPSYK